MLIKYPHLKESLENSILDNPHDFEREYFVENVIRNIAYFQNCTGKILREIYYRGTMKSYNINESLFNIGDKSDKLYVIISGVVEISIKSKRIFQQLDLLGRGSLIGISGIVLDNEFGYQGIVRSTKAA